LQTAVFIWLLASFSYLQIVVNLFHLARFVPLHYYNCLKRAKQAKDVKIKSAKSKNGKLRCQRQLNNRKMQNAKDTQHALKRKTSKKEKKSKEKLKYSMSKAGEY
jgi:hypothetical protein